MSDSYGHTPANKISETTGSTYTSYQSAILSYPKTYGTQSILAAPLLYTSANQNPLSIYVVFSSLLDFHHLSVI
jgi:hypothetical protein